MGPTICSYVVSKSSGTAKCVHTCFVVFVVDETYKDVCFCCIVSTTIHWYVGSQDQ